MEKKIIDYNFVTVQPPLDEVCYQTRKVTNIGFPVHDPSARIFEDRSPIPKPFGLSIETGSHPMNV
jgi:hypothetical protein